MNSVFTSLRHFRPGLGACAPFNYSTRTRVYPVSPLVDLHSLASAYPSLGPPCSASLPSFSPSSSPSYPVRSRCPSPSFKLTHPVFSSSFDHLLACQLPKRHVPLGHRLEESCVMADRGRDRHHLLRHTAAQFEPLDHGWVHPDRSQGTDGKIEVE